MTKGYVLHNKVRGDGRKPFLFLSHSGKDKILAVQLAQTIRQTFDQQSDVFDTSEPQYRMKEHDPKYALRLGDNWQKRIRILNELLGKERTSKIENSAGVLLLVTPQSTMHHSPWIELEIEAGTTRGVKERHPFFFPIVTGGAKLQDLPGKAGEFQGVDLSEKDGLHKLLMSISNTVNI